MQPINCISPKWIYINSGWINILHYGSKLGCWGLSLSHTHFSVTKLQIPEKYQAILKAALGDWESPDVTLMSPELFRRQMPKYHGIFLQMHFDLFNLFLSASHQDDDNHRVGDSIFLSNLTFHWQTAEGDSHPIALIAMSGFHRFIPSWFLKAGSQQWDRDSSCFNGLAGLLPTVWQFGW